MKFLNIRTDYFFTKLEILDSYPKYVGRAEQFRLDYKIGGEKYNQEDDELFINARMNNEIV